MNKKIELSIKPIYQELLAEIKTDQSVCTFCAQWGDKFFDEENDRILFVGKAVNGLVTNSRKIEVLFGSDDSRIFARDDQMQWVDNLDGKKKGYNTRKSAFWRVIRKTAKKILADNDVISRIAWSNIYKISPDSGNPNGKLQKIQKDYCKRLLRKEIELLEPKYVIFLTSFWETEFMEYLNNGIKPKLIETKIWGKNYESSSYKIGDIIYLTSQHPQGKNEDEHTRVLTDLIISANKASA
jgi:uracil-DNA glycosylase